MNAFKRRKNVKKSVSTDNLSNDAKMESSKPTFESIVQRVMKMRVNEGVKAENESPPDMPIKGAVLATPSMSSRNQISGHQRRSRSHQRRVLTLCYTI